MPSTKHAPRACLATQFDARPWSNTHVFTFDGVAVTLPTYTGAAGLFDDALDLLNGRGRHWRLFEEIQGQLAGAGWTGGAGALVNVYLLADDKLSIRMNVPFQITDVLNASHYGWAAPQNGLFDPGSGDYIADAPGEWRRGAFTAQFSMHETGGGPGGAITIPQYRYQAQSCMSLMRLHAAGDADSMNATGNLEARLDAIAGVAKFVRWGVDDNGHVFVACDVAHIGAGLAWVSTTFRDRLGFTGSETWVSSGNLRLMTATHRLPGLIVPRVPLRRLTQWRANRGTTAERSDGDLVGVAWGGASGWRAEGYIDGLMSPSAEHQHWVDSVCPHFRAAEPVTIYPEWGDPRRSRVITETNTVGSYTTLYTSQESGLRGRLRGRLSPDQEEWDWTPETDAHRRGQFSLQIHNRTT